MSEADTSNALIVEAILAVIFCDFCHSGVFNDSFSRRVLTRDVRSRRPTQSIFCVGILSARGGMDGHIFHRICAEHSAVYSW